MSGPGLTGRLRATIGAMARRRLGQPVDRTSDGHAGRPFAEFVGVLDGRHLWLAVADLGAGAEDSLGLLLPDGGVVRLDTQREVAAPSAPAVLSVTVDLVDLASGPPLAGHIPADDDLELTPVLATSSGDTRPVWTPPGSLTTRDRRPESLPPGLQPRLRRRSDGTVALLLRVTERRAHAVGFGHTATGIDLRVATSERVTQARVLNGDDPSAVTLATLEVTSAGDDVIVRVTPDVPLPAGTACPLLIDTARDSLSPARPADDVGDAEAATRMPGVVAADGTWMVRLGWDRKGHVVLLRDVLEECTGDEAGNDAGDWVEGPAEGEVR